MCSEEDQETDIFEGGDSLPYWLFRAMAARAEAEPCERGVNDPCGISGDCITEYCVPCAAKIWMDETRRAEALKPTCESCRGYGYFDQDSEPTIDKRGRKCSDCQGTGLL